MKIVVQNGRIIDPAQQLDKISDICIENGTIAHIGALTNTKADVYVDATNQWIIPGLVDSCCRPHLQHPHGSTLQEEARAAITAGFTTLCIPPDGDLIIDTPANVSRLKQQGEKYLPRLQPMGALTKQLAGESMTDMSALATSGCIALSQAMHPVKDLSILRHCYDYASSFGLLVVIQPLEPSLARGGIIHEGLVSAQLGFQGIPAIAETVAIQQHLQLIKDTGIRAHFTCLSSSEAVDLLRLAKAQGLPVSADCAMHSLHLTENDLTSFDANCHVYPPLRSQQDKEGLLAGLLDGTIDAICSDHRPLDSVAKLAPFGDTVPGMSTMDTFLALGLQLVREQQLPVQTFIKAISYQPANIFRLSAGTLAVGARGDLCILDPNRIFEVTPETLQSSGKNSPFMGKALSGQAIMTLVDGDIVHEV